MHAITCTSQPYQTFTFLNGSSNPCSQTVILNVSAKSFFLVQWAWEHLTLFANHFPPLLITSTSTKLGPSLMRLRWVGMGASFQFFARWASLIDGNKGSSCVCCKISTDSTIKIKGHFGLYKITLSDSLIKETWSSGLLINELVKPYSRKNPKR